MTTRHFTFDPASVAHARRFVASAVEGADVELAQLLITELATNALVHARTDFTVTVESDSGHVTVGVADQSPVEPVLRLAAPEDVRGRGLFLVASLAEQWGVERHDAGKLVWFQLPRD